MLIVCASASSTQGLGLTCQLREHLGTTATSEDERMRQMLLRATDWAERMTGRTFGAQLYQETVPAYGGQSIMVTGRPIIAVLRLFDSSATSEGTEYTTTQFRVEDAEAGLITRDEGFAWTNDGVRGGGRMALGLGDAVLPGWERRPWLVEYVAGYIFPAVATSNAVWTTEGGTTSTERTLPYDVEEAVLLRAARTYGGGLDVTSRRVGDLMVTYRERREEEYLLAGYRSIV